MASDKLKKYLAYYQKILRDEPENIEARLRLAALFREMGSKSHAVDEYVAASKLLAAQGLPLEAIAACKAVLELDPSHTEVQFFLARLFAQAPDALGRAARVAKPVGELPSSTPSPTLAEIDPVSMKLEVLNTDEMDAFIRSGEQPITLAQPKRDAFEHEFTREDELPTGIHVATSLGDEPTQARASTHEQVTRAAPEPVASLTIKPLEETTRPEVTVISPEVTRRAQLDAAHMASFDESDPLEFAASSDEIARARAATSDDMRETVSYEQLEELRETQAFDPEELRALSTHNPPSSPSWKTLDRTLHKHVSQELLDAMARSSSATEEDTLERVKIEESFELNVFDMESVQLSAQDLDEVFGEELSDPMSSEVTEASMNDDTGVLPPKPTLVSVVRDDLPDIPLLSRLNQYAFVELLQRARMREVEAGEVILSPGHQLKNLYIVLSGEVAVSKSVDEANVRLGTFTEGDFFGEFALLTGRDYSATVRAVKRTHLLEISEELVNHIATYDEEIWDTLWDYYHTRMLNNLMVSDNIFRHLGTTERDDIIDEFELNEYEAGDQVLAPDVPCPFVCLVLFGVLQITPVNTELPSKTLREGEFFGFVASLSREPCQATIRALKDASLLCLPANQFRDIIRRNAGMSAEIRSLLRARVHRTDLFLTGVTHYAASGFSD